MKFDEFHTLRTSPGWQESSIKAGTAARSGLDLVNPLILISIFYFQNFSIWLGQSTMLEPGMDQSL
jgi:hypothetical protein